MNVYERSLTGHRRNGENMLKAIGSDIDLSVPSDCEYYDHVKDVLESDVVQSMKQFHHHGHTSCFQHCVNVSFYNFKLCKALGLNARAAARAGLLHDLFLYDWHDYVKEPGQQLHGWTHPRTALNNARKYFKLSPLEEDIILKHMFPLTTALPKYPETVCITLTDKFCGAWEVIDHWVYIARKGIHFVRKVFAQ